MNQRNNQNLENIIQKSTTTSGSSSSGGGIIRRGSSLDTASMASSQKRFSLRREAQYQSMIEENSVDSDGSNMTSVTTTTTASSASSPPSATHTRSTTQLIIHTPTAQQRQIQFRRRMQQQKIAQNVMMKIQHQNRSDPSSSDEGVSQPMKHRIATGIHMAHNKTIAPAGLITETIEMKQLPSPPSSASSICEARHQTIEDSIKTMSPMTVSSEHDTIETTLSMRDSEKADDDGHFLRSRSFHGKGGQFSMFLMLNYLLYIDGILYHIKYSSDCKFSNAVYQACLSLSIYYYLFSLFLLL